MELVIGVKNKLLNSDVMNTKLRKQYCELLSNKIVAMFSVTKEYADCAIQNSAIQNLLDEIPDYVDHVPLEEWAYEVYNESRRCKYE